jgi:hypothetical protein
MDKAAKLPLPSSINESKTYALMHILQVDIIKNRAVGLWIGGTEHPREGFKAYVSRRQQQ